MGILAREPLWSSAIAPTATEHSTGTLRPLKMPRHFWSFECISHFKLQQVQAFEFIEFVAC